MFCPVCSQQQTSEETRFCSRCGFLLTGVSQLIANGGAPLANLAPADPKFISPRKKGIKQGALLMMSSLIIVPLTAMITISVMGGPFPIAVAAIITFWGGLLRIIYALLFESNAPSVDANNILPDSIVGKLPGVKKSAPALNAGVDNPVNFYVPPARGDWRETNDLAAPSSVTEETTKFLTKE